MTDGRTNKSFSWWGFGHDETVTNSNTNDNDNNETDVDKKHNTRTFTMASFFCFSLSLPVGVWVGHEMEKRQCFRTSIEGATSAGQYLRYRVHGYAVLSWVGFACFLTLLWNTGSHGLSIIDARTRQSTDDVYSDGYSHDDDDEYDDGNADGNGGGSTAQLAMGILLGMTAGLSLGCGLAGSMLNYGQLRTSDSRVIDNNELSMELIGADDTDSNVHEELQQ